MSKPTLTKARMKLYAVAIGAIVGLALLAPRCGVSTDVFKAAVGGIVQVVSQ